MDVNEVCFGFNKARTAQQTFESVLDYIRERRALLVSS
jgi:hypothetical protein